LSDIRGAVNVFSRLLRSPRGGTRDINTPHHPATPPSANFCNFPADGDGGRLPIDKLCLRPLPHKWTFFIWLGKRNVPGSYVLLPVGQFGLKDVARKVETKQGALNLILGLRRGFVKPMLGNKRIHQSECILIDNLPICLYYAGISLGKRMAARSASPC